MDVVKHLSQNDENHEKIFEEKLDKFLVQKLEKGEPKIVEICSNIISNTDHL